MNKKVMGAALCVATMIGAGSTAAAGEVTGNGKSTPAGGRASSACAFSGLEDGITLIGFDENGVPQFIVVDTGPGLVQNPHMENAAGIIHAPGIPGQECRGNAGSDL
jgi:hypothetical protein